MSVVVDNSVSLIEYRNTEKLPDSDNIKEKVRDQELQQQKKKHQHQNSINSIM